MHYVYILESTRNGKYYIGSTNDVTKRLRQHNNGMYLSSKRLGPFVLKFKQNYSTISEARKIELRLKKLKRRDYLDKIIQNSKITIRGH